MILKGKSIIISGVGPGMGRPMAVQAAKEGAQVAIAARSAEFLNEIVKEIESNGGTAIAVPTDVRNTDACANLVQKAVEKFGRVDGLVNAAYRYDPPAPIEKVDLEDWTDSLNITFMSALRLIKFVTPYMKKQGGGSIVNIGSMVVRKPSGFDGIYYTAGKGALAAATRALAYELGPDNIRVNMALSGWMWGAPAQNYIKENAKATGVPEKEQIDFIASRIALRRIPPDVECAKTTLYLLSDYASVVTGAMIDVNGGEYMPP
jgi:NAD(P)-dependent dehydrogenase (short-subunit alcohol dehydrogenase family)